MPAMSRCFATAAADAPNLASAMNIGAFNPSAGEVEAEVRRAFPNAQISYKIDTKRQGIVDSWPADALEQATQLGCVALICNYVLWDATRVAQAHALGLRTLSYTVNDASVAAHLLALGTDGVITDRVDLFAPDA